jgi:hypothetical protein
MHEAGDYTFQRSNTTQANPHVMPCYSTCRLAMVAKVFESVALSNAEGHSGSSNLATLTSNNSSQISEGQPGPNLHSAAQLLPG